MYNHLGARCKLLRTQVYKESQSEFASSINKNILKNHSLNTLKEYKFTQNVILRLENESNIKRNKLLYLFNYLYETKKINPLWLILDNNKSQPKFLVKVKINETISQKSKKIEESFKKMKQEINDIDIILSNQNY